MIHIVICRLALTPFLWSINFYLLHFTLQLYIAHSGVTVCSRWGIHDILSLFFWSWPHSYCLVISL